MPFTLEDLDRISVRVGMGTKTLRQMSDTQFTAWLRAQGARGDIGVVKVGPGELMIPIEERVRVLNDLDRQGFYIEGVMGTQPAEHAPDPALLAKALEHLTQARAHLEEVEAAISELGEIDPRVNMRVSIHGALELVELLRGAVEHGPRGRSGLGPIP
jgi:phosphosulfolactate synthase (CoM biosynthesis protein A)